MERPFCTLETGESPLVAAAIHDGHFVRKEMEGLLAIKEADRLREEDPHTGLMTQFVQNRIVANHSRFEVDLNRPREGAVYSRPEDSWGLEVWKTPLPSPVLQRSLGQYDLFHREVHSYLCDLEKRFGCFMVYDLHSYNHRRQGPEAPPADPEWNPEVNIGTGTLDRDRWGFLIDRFVADLRDFDFQGRRLDVRENVKFRGGHFSRWIHENFPASGCCLAIEFKKFFMDEWTGEVDLSQVESIRNALSATTEGVLECLGPMWRGVAA